MIMYLLDKQQNIIKAISGGIIEAKMTEEINAADKLSFSLVQNKRLASNIYYVCIPDTSGNAFLMFKIISESVKDDRIEYTCIESAYDELKSYAYIKDLRPQDKTAGEMLQIALAGTRWETGYLAETTRKRTNFYYISTLEAIQKIVEVFKVELTFSIVIDPLTNRITRRQVNLYDQQGERTGKRFEYGSNLLSVTREESSEDLVTALVGRGKGEQLDDGNDDTPDGYGRRIMFTDVVWSKTKGNPTDKPAGQEYVEDKEATKLYGFDDGKPRIGIAVFEDIEDVNQLIKATWSALQVAKRPKVSFKASALDVGDLGLGDTVAIIRHELGIEYFTRVYKVEHDLLDKNNNVIELGDDFSEKSLTNYVASVKEAQEETSRVANIALTSANGKNKNFYSNVKPTNAAEGDNLYLDLGNGETEYYIYKNGNWELILSTQDTAETKRAVDQALADLEDVRTTAEEAFNTANNASNSANSLFEEIQGMNARFLDMLYGTEDKLNAQMELQVKSLSDDFDKNVASVNLALSNLNAAKDKASADINKLITDVSGVRGLYADLNGRMTQFSAGIDGLSAQLKDTNNQLASVKLTADGANVKFANQQNEIANLKTRAGTMEQQMLAKVDNNLFESFKSSTARELKEKLVASDLNGYIKTAEFTKTTDGLRASISETNGKINDLDIQNLVYNSEFRNDAEGWTKDNYLLSNNNINFASNEYDTWKGSTGLAFRNTTNPKGYLYATSKRVKVLNSDKISASVQLHVTDMVTEIPNYVSMSLVFFDAETGGRYIGSVTNISQRAADIGNGHSQLLYCDNVSVPSGASYVALKLTTWGKGNFIFNQPMMTISSKHLPYKQDQKIIDAVQQRYVDLNVKVDGISSLVANKADRSYVEQKANEISSVVSSKADLSYVNQKADQWMVTLQNMKLGGENLIPNSNASEEDAVPWTSSKSTAVRLFKHPFYYNGTKNMFNVDNATSQVIPAVSQRFSIKPNTEYTLSFVGFASTNSDGYNIFLRGKKNNIDKQSQFISGGKLSASKLDYKSTTFTTGDIDSAELSFNISGSTNGNVANFFFNEVMLVEGNKAQSWAPAPADTDRKYTKLNVKIDGVNSVVINKADKSYVDQRADQINSVVAGKADTSFVNQTASTWQTKLQDAQKTNTVAISAVKNELVSAINLRVQKGDVLSQLNIEAGRTLIQTKKLYLDADTVAFSGKAFIPSAAITDLTADKIKTGTLNAANVSIINLDVNRLTGNKTEFVRSSWRNAYGQYVNIDASGMRVTYGNTTTTFNTKGMKIKAVNEDIGGIGWQNMVGMPDHFQGLSFWLDGGGDYMAWSARDSGNYNMNPIVKLGWYRYEWLPSGVHAGFNFADPVTFNKELRIWGNIYGKGAASGADTHLHFQTFTDGSAGLVNDLNSGFVIKNNGDIGLMHNGSTVWLAGKSVAQFNSDGTASKWWTI